MQLAIDSLQHLSARLQRASLGRMLMLSAGVLLVCLVFGYVTANFVALFGSSPAKLVVLPLVLVVLMLFVLSPLKFFLGALVLRSVGDPIFDMIRLPGGGVGGMLNFLMIFIAVLVVFKDGARISRSHVVLWLLVLGGLALAIVPSPQPFEAMRLYVGFLSNFAIFVVAFHVRPREELALKFGASLTIWSSVLPSVYGIYTAATQMGGGLAGFRMMSSFAHPNIYAFYLVLVLTLLLYVLRSPDWRLTGSQRFWLWAYFGLQSLLLGLTMTRSAWVGYVVVLGIYALMYERKWLIYLLVLPVVAMMVPQIRDRILDLGKGNEVVQYAELNSFAWRVALWESAFDYMDLKGYLIGYGLESFRWLSLVFFKLAGNTMWGSHSVFVQCIFELGLLGCIPSALLYLKVFKDGAATLRRDKVAGFVVLAVAIQYLVTATSDNLLYYLVYNWYYWFVLGCAAADALSHDSRLAAAASGLGALRRQAAR